MVLASRHFVRYCARFAKFSTKSGRKSSAELSFKEENSVSSPFEVLDGSLSDMSFRLRLFEAFRLREQFLLDRTELQALGKDNEKFAPEGSSSVLNPPLTISQTVLAREPGVEQPTVESNNSLVEVSVNLSALNLEPSQMSKLRRLANISAETPTLQFKVQDFPFQSQNRMRALQIVQSLLGACKDPHVGKEESVGSDSLEPSGFTRKAQRKRTAGLQFPVEWLNGLRQAG
jgi:hypothetical protein